MVHTQRPMDDGMWPTILFCGVETNGSDLGGVDRKCMGDFGDFEFLEDLIMNLI